MQNQEKILIRVSIDGVLRFVKINTYILKDPLQFFSTGKVRFRSVCCDFKVRYLLCFSCV